MQAPEAAYISLLPISQHVSEVAAFRLAHC